MSSDLLVLRPVRYDHPDATVMTDAVQDYYRTLYNGPDSSPVDPDEFTPPNGRFFVGYLDGAAVAMGGWRWIEPLAELGAVRPAEIKRMYVDVDHRGHGHARTLLAHLETTAKAAGADAVVLSTGQPQQDAIALYRSEAYVDVPPFGYFAPYDTAVHLGKWLLPRGPASGTTASARLADETAR